MQIPVKVQLNLSDIDFKNQCTSKPAQQMSKNASSSIESIWLILSVCNGTISMWNLVFPTLNWPQLDKFILFGVSVSYRMNQSLEFETDFDE